MSPSDPVNNMCHFTSCGGAQVLARMKQLMVDNNTAASHSFLLDDDSSIPFSLDDIAALMEDKVSCPFAVDFHAFPTTISPQSCCE